MAVYIYEKDAIVYFADNLGVILKQKTYKFLTLSLSLICFVSSVSANKIDTKQKQNNSLYLSSCYEMDEAHNFKAKLIITEQPTEKSQKYNHFPMLKKYNHFPMSQENNRFFYSSLEKINKKSKIKQQLYVKIIRKSHAGCKKNLSKPFNKTKKKKKLLHLTSKPTYKSKVSKNINLNFRSQEQPKSKPQEKTDLKGKFIISEIEKPPQFFYI